MINECNLPKENLLEKISTFINKSKEEIKRLESERKKYITDGNLSKEKFDELENLKNRHFNDLKIFLSIREIEKLRNSLIEVKQDNIVLAEYIKKIEKENEKKNEEVFDYFLSAIADIKNEIKSLEAVIFDMKNKKKEKKKKQKEKDMK